MRAQVVIDKEGKVVSALYRRRPAAEDDLLRPEMGPVVPEGHNLVELSVPDEYADYPAEQFVERLAADAQARLREAGPKRK